MAKSLGIIFPKAPEHWGSKRVSRYQKGCAAQNAQQPVTDAQETDIRDAYAYRDYVDKYGVRPPPPLGPTVTTSSSSESSEGSLHRDAASSGSSGDSGNSGTTNLSREDVFVPSDESIVDEAPLVEDGSDGSDEGSGESATGVSPYVWAVAILALAGGALFGAKKMGYL